MADVNQVTIVNGIPTAGSGTVDTLIVTNALLRQLVGGDEYETVAAATTSVLGATGALSDYITRLILVPATTAPGVVQIKDGGGSAINIYTGSSSYDVGLPTMTVDIGLSCVTTGGWSVITGSNVSVIAVGSFT